MLYKRPAPCFAAQEKSFSKTLDSNLKKDPTKCTAFSGIILLAKGLAALRLALCSMPSRNKCRAFTVICAALRYATLLFIRQLHQCIQAGINHHTRNLNRCTHLCNKTSLHLAGLVRRKTNSVQTNDKRFGRITRLGGDTHH